MCRLKERTLQQRRRRRAIGMSWLHHAMDYIGELDGKMLRQIGQLSAAKTAKPVLEGRIHGKRSIVAPKENVGSEALSNHPTVSRCQETRISLLNVLASFDSVASPAPSNDTSDRPAFDKNVTRFDIHGTTLCLRK